MSVDIHKADSPITRIQFGCNVSANDYIEIKPDPSNFCPTRVMIKTYKEHAEFSCMVVNACDLRALACGLHDLADQIYDYETK